MKTLKAIGAWNAILLSVVVITGCATKPGIEMRDDPVVRTAGADLVIAGKSYCASTRNVLKAEGLTREVRRDPAAVIQQWHRRLVERDHPEIRLAAAEVALDQAFRNYRAKSGEVVGYLLTAIELSEPGLSYKASTVRLNLIAIYNEGSAELAWLLHEQALGKKKAAAQGPLRSYTVGWGQMRRQNSRPEFYDELTPASRLEVQGFDQNNIRQGMGGSMVGYRAPTDARRAEDPFMPPHSGYALSLTAVVNWEKKGTARVVLHDSGEVETVSIDGKRYPLAADFTAAVATVVAAAPPPKAGFIGMLRPESSKKNEGLFTIEPFREDRIPLVLIHGLLSTPGTWREVINACYADPVIRSNYQLMVFFYPTGFPIPVNAAVLREDLKAFRQRHDPQRRNSKMRKMVVVGHSMGCNLTNFQIRDGGDELWSKFFNKPIEEMNMPPEEVARFRRVAYFEANPDIDRVVFLCGPHRGSPLSNAWLGRFGARLIRLPFQMVDQVSGNMLSSATPLGQSMLSESSSSINNLEEHAPILEAILKQPIPHKPKIHSILGDRGKGDGVNSSDGVVPYWSAHLDGVVSEEFIPESHTSATNSAGNIKAVRRILYEHLGKKVPVTP